MDTYRSSEQATRDKAQLTELFEALHAASSALRRNADGLWVLRGKPGCYACTWGDGGSWQLVVTPEQELSKLAWTWIRKRLAFRELSQDGDAEGVFHLHHLPTPEQAEAIRDVLGIRKRKDYSPEELARLRERGRLLAASQSSLNPAKPAADPR